MRDMGVSIALAVVPSESISRSVPWQLSLLLAAGISVSSALAAFLNRRATSIARRGLVVASCFVMTGIMVAIAGRTRYEWGAEISVRHASQYDWLLLPLGVMLVLCGLRGRTRAILRAAGGIAAIVVMLRGYEVADRWSFLRAADNTVNEAIASGVYPSSDVGRHLQARQFFRHYEHMIELRTASRKINPRCTIISNIYELLIAQYDIAALPSDQRALDDRDVVLIQALLPNTTSANGAAYTIRLMPVRIRGLPASVQVFSSSPKRCLGEAASAG
jgi:hypothetical protein